MTALERETKKKQSGGQQWLQQRRQWWRRPGLNVTPAAARYAALAALCALCYGNSLRGELVHDDVWAIVNNPDVRAGSSLRSIFTNDFWGKRMADNTSHKSYRPLCILSFK